MQAQFDALIKTSVVPILKQRGYKKQALTFTKSGNELLYLINFQKSSANCQQEVRFYINCAIYSSRWAEMLGRTPLSNPKEYECHYRQRFEDITGYSGQFLTLTNTESLLQTANIIVAQLDKIDNYFTTIADLNDLIALIAQQSSLALSEEVIIYFIKQGQQDKAQQFYQQLYNKYGQEPRWQKWQDKYQPLLQQLI